MFRRIAGVAVMVLAMAFVARSARADDSVNPEYKIWSDFNVGSSETIEGTMSLPQGDVVATTTSKLTEKTADHLSVEVSQSMLIGGMSRALPPRTTTVPAAPDPAKKVKQIGTEDVTAAGKTFSCKIYTTDNPQLASKVDVKIWMSSEVPGGVVKVQVVTSTGKKIVQMLKSFEVK
jgi:hypothetical protein